MDSPPTANGGSIVRSATAGTPIFVNAWVRDPQGRPVAGAEVDVWHTSGEGCHENQDPEQADMNLRGKFTTDAQGCIAFRRVKPAGYPHTAERSGGRTHPGVFERRSERRAASGERPRQAVLERAP
ncbi:hypothetical protein V4F39_06810 [Aquincola sp. MAHUQ-54]|uniref:Intradiol ring-cleavage dioxygenases domain-containing protein n=2 Tax=Sphaerotilaceae TaxID=2975441 RepID=A0AAW9QD17_9BURK